MKRTTFGTPAGRGHSPLFDADGVARCRACGAVLFAPEESAGAALWKGRGFRVILMQPKRRWALVICLAPGLVPLDREDATPTFGLPQRARQGRRDPYRRARPTDDYERVLNATHVRIYCRGCGKKHQCSFMRTQDRA